MTSVVIDAGDDLPLTLPALWRRQVRQHADRELLVCDGTRLSYGDAERRSRRMACGLLAAGAGKGTHVALLYPNGADFIIGLLAAARIGAVVVPLSTLSTADELRWLLIHSDASFLLCASEFRSRLYGRLLQQVLPDAEFSRPPPLCLTGLPWLRRIGFSGKLPQGFDAGWSIEAFNALNAETDDGLIEALEARVLPADRLVIIHTSGSTGNPKGVVHTHGSLIRHLDNINQIRGLRYSDRLFGTAPWFWVAGFAFSLFGTMLAGACIICSNTTAAADILDLLERERPTTTNGYAPTVARLAADPSFASRDLSSIQRGNLYPIMAPAVKPLDPALRHDIYGMSEAGGALTMSGDEGDLPERLRGSCGPFLPGFEARIVDAATGRDCEAGQMGELWIRGPFMMEGYYGKCRSEVFEPDGWWRTRDVGLIDREGFFYIKGRLDEMIRTAGASVAPREVEAVLRELTDGLQSFVVGLPDAGRGQVVTALVVANDDVAVDEDGLRQRLAARLSTYKVPRRIFRINESAVPYLSSGKVDMNRLRALAHQRSQELPLHHSPG